MAISPKSGRINRSNHPSLANWPNRALSSHYSLCLLENLPAHPHGYIAPFSRPSASFEFSSILSTRSIQDTTPEGVPAKCGCSLTLTLTTSIGIWHSAGVTKGVTSPAAHRGIWHGAGVTKSWFLVLHLSCSCPISSMCHQLHLNSLCFFVRTLTVVLFHSSWFTID